MGCRACHSARARLAWAEADLASIARKAAARPTTRLIGIVAERRRVRDVARQMLIEHESECISDAETGLADCPTPRVASALPTN